MKNFIFDGYVPRDKTDSYLANQITTQEDLFVSEKQTKEQLSLPAVKCNLTFS